MNKLRTRTRTTPLPLMELGTIDYVNLGTTSPKRGYLAAPLPVMVEIGEGLDQVTVDENHGRPPYNVGGPFFSRRIQYPVYPQGSGVYYSKSGQPPHGAATRPPDEPGSDWRICYTGAFTSDWNTYGAPAPPGESIKKPEDYDGFSNRNDMQDLGNRAYNKLRPKVEKASLLQSVIEARDIPRTLKTTAADMSTAYRALGGSDVPGFFRSHRGKWHQVKGFDPNVWKSSPKRVADSFLNYQFGWKPMLRDLDQLCKLVLDFETYVKNAEKRNDVWLHRKFVEDDILSEVVVTSLTGQNQNYCLPAMNTGAWVVPGSSAFKVRRQQRTRVWYAGLFKYYREEFDSGLQSGYPAVRKLQQALTLSGANISPAVLYKVTPWSWFADWFVNVGDAVQRFQDLATGSVASKYFYLMRETVDRYVISCSWRMYSGSSLAFEWERGVTVKRRVGSNSPFNFTLLPGGDLSATQMGILAALGLSQGR